MKTTSQKLAGPMKRIGRAKQYDGDGGPTEPVKVFCRLRPLSQPDDVSCMRIVSDNTVVITPPASAVNFRSNSRAIQTTFSHVFGPKASQSDVFNLVALPLVEHLLNGKNGLLFTYGVTGSGKTYTMSGSCYEAGIMPRCLDVIFNSLASYQTRKYVFKPDKLNSFDVQSDTDAMLDRQAELNAGFPGSQYPKAAKLEKRSDSDSSSSHTIVPRTDETLCLPVDPDYAYAVFVTYIEIYNNSVYDLLGEEDGKNKPLQSKIIREDGNRNMYVHGGTEVEVKSSEEAFELFQRGQRRRRVAYTTLNAESSRSHSIFTIRLVQAPLDSEGEQVVQDKRVVCVSQLSLVDLAGSERTNRSKNTGQRLREAGNINNSLMTLRTCLEILRENQAEGTNKLVPYRDSKLTHFFKNYFDGEGNVRMIICVNPSADDYDETIQVMKFAEMSQEVQIANPEPQKVDLGYTPGRRHANKIFKEARTRLERAGHEEAANLQVDLGLVYSLGGPFPEFDVNNPYHDEVVTSLMRFLEQRIQKRNLLRENLREKQENFRNMLVKVEHENVALKIENMSLNATLDQQKKKITALENHVCKTESQIDTLINRLNGANDAIRQLQQQLREKDMALNQRAIERQRAKERYNNKIQTETDKMSKELETKLRHQRDRLQNQIKEKEEKLKLMKQILVNEEDVNKQTDDNLTKCASGKPKKVTIQATSQEIINSTTTTTATTTTETTETKTSSKFDEPDNILASKKNISERIPVVNPRYRRSRSADRWIDHRPGNLVPVGTILQPLLPKRRSVTQLTDPRDFTDRASRYCLVAQEQDTDGELETKLYKGDILPTSGGGAQVIFNDLEHLKQVSPVSRRKRSGNPSPEPRIRKSTDSSKKPRV